MQKLILLVIIACFASQIVSASATSENVSREIERIEINGTFKTVYYSDGSKESFFTVVESLQASTGVAQVIGVSSPAPLNPFPIIDKILKLIKQILDTLNSCGVGYSLLAWSIWNVIKRLRRGRPRDYRGIAYK